MRSFVSLVILVALVALGSSEEMFEGDNVHTLTDSNFEEVLSHGKWLVKFYAPWCGHCKHLAPIWDEAAGIMDGVVSFAKIDCTTHTTQCGVHGVKGYPTLKYFENGKARDFKGGRQLEHIVDYAKMVSGPAFTRVSEKSFEQFMKKPKNKFLLFSDDNRLNDDAFTEIADAFKTDGTFGLTRDEKLFTKHRVKSAPEVIAFKGDDTARIALGKNVNTTTLSKFVDDHRLPLLTQLNIANAFDYQDNVKQTVLGIVNPREKERTEKFLKDLREVAEGETEHRFLFAWIDGLKWTSFAENFGIDEDRFPCAFVWHPKEGFYYEDPEVKTKEDLVRFIDDVHSGKIKPQGAGKGAFADFYKVYLAVSMQASKHPLVATGVAVFVVALFVVCCCFMDMDEPPLRPEGRMKGSKKSQ